MIIKIFKYHFALLLIVSIACLSSCAQSDREDKAMNRDHHSSIYGSGNNHFTEKDREQQRINGLEFLRLIEDKPEIISLQKKHYRFSTHDTIKDAIINFSDLHNLTIDGNGATFWFENFNTAVKLRRCNNVTIKNLTIDYDPLPFTQGIITGIQENILEIQNEEGYLTSLEIEERTGKVKSKIFVFDSDTHLLKKEIPHMVALGFEDAGQGKTRIHTSNYVGISLTELDNLHVGDKVAIKFHKGDALMLEHCYNVSVKGVNIYASPHYGIYAINGGGGIRIIDCNIIPRPEMGRLLSTNRDAIHLITAETGPHIEGCRLACTGDDAVNIHGDFHIVQKQKSTTEIVISAKHYLTLKKGDKITIYDSESLRSKGTFMIKNLEVNQEQSLIRDAKEVGDELRAYFWPGNLSVTCTIDKPVKTSRGDIVENPSRSANGTFIVNNHIYNTSTLGLMVNANDAVIKKNRFTHIAGSGLLVMASMEWFEGPFSKNIQIAQNSLSSIGYSLNTRKPGYNKLGAISVLVEYFGPLKQNLYNINNIEITNNRVEDTPLSGIFMIHVDSVEVTGNVVKNFANGEQGEMGKHLGLRPFAGIYLASTRNLLLDQNSVLNPGQSAIANIIIGP